MKFQRNPSRSANLHPLYRTWVGMKARCYNPRLPIYRNYGGRGIRVCDRWLDDFDAFVKDVGVRPSRDYSLDRIDNNGNYEPHNVRWATRLEQARNSRRPNRYTYRGETKTVSEFAEQYRVSANLLRSRLKQGMNIDEAIERPFGRWPAQPK